MQNHSTLLNNIFCEIARVCKYLANGLYTVISTLQFTPSAHFKIPGANFIRDRDANTHLLVPRMHEIFWENGTDIKGHLKKRPYYLCNY